MRTMTTFLFASVASATMAAGVAPPLTQGGSGPASAPALSTPVETTDWMGTVVAEEQARQFRKAGRAMVGIECRANSNLDVDAGEGTEFRFASAINDAKLEWTWREFPSPDMKAVDRKLSGEGFRLVVRQDFRRQPSGQQRTCALWHK